MAWGITIRNGFDEMDDPGYHLGTTQHAYLEGNDNVAICGFRPPQSGPRTRRRSRLGMPTAGEHPMCGMCARMVVAPRPRVPIPVQPGRVPVAVPIVASARPVVSIKVAPRTAIPTVASVAPSDGGAASVAPNNGLGPATPPLPPAQPPAAATSPWIQRIEGDEPDPGYVAPSGLMGRGVQIEYEK